MAQDSAVWDGTATGDANSLTKWYAPYSASRWSSIMDYLLAASYNGGYVLPAYGNNLAISASSPADMNVHVASGSMFIKGKLYENTTDLSFTVASNGGATPRIDRVVLQVNYAAQTIRATIKQGLAAALPALPKLTQTSTTYEIPLAYIWVASGATSIGNTEIHDERVFASTSLIFSTQSYTNNLIRNSEFMGFSELSGGATTNPPDLWDLVSTPSDIADYAKPSQMIRGRAVQITANGANEGISQTFEVKPSTVYSIKVLSRVASGKTGSIVVTTNSAAPTTITKYTRRAIAWFEEKIIYTTEADATTMTVQLMSLASGDITQYGQLLVVEGYVSGQFRQIHETIMFSKAITDAQWNNTQPTVSASLVQVYFNQHYQKLILEGTKDLLIGMELTDTTATTMSSSITVTGNGLAGSIRIFPTGGLINAAHYQQGWIHTSKFSTYDMQIQTVKSSDNAAIYVSVYILGIRI